MDDAGALADLQQLAPQLGAIVVFDAEGRVRASTSAELGAFADAVAELLDAAADLRSGERRVERLSVATGEGWIFAAADEERTVAAAAGADAVPALVLHDLKMFLARLHGGSDAGS